jgi:molybdate transport system regulatory protein
MVGKREKMPQPLVKLRLILPEGRTFGPGKAELLTLIDRYGSIAAAGREMRMSYKRAWGLVEEMNASFREALVTTERGGAGHGGAKVTDLGHTVLARYQSLVARAEEAGAEDLGFLGAALVEIAGSLSTDETPVMFDKT